MVRQPKLTHDTRLHHHSCAATAHPVADRPVQIMRSTATHKKMVDYDAMTLQGHPARHLVLCPETCTPRQHRGPGHSASTSAVAGRRPVGRKTCLDARHRSHAKSDRSAMAASSRRSAQFCRPVRDKLDRACRHEQQSMRTSALASAPRGEDQGWTQNINWPRRSAYRRSAVAQRETGRAARSRRTCTRIAAALGVGVDTYPMYGHDKAAPGQVQRGDELAILRLYRECAPEDRQLLLRTARRLAKTTRRR